MIRAANISKSYGTQVLLDNVSFAVGAGEKIGLVGRNGHGKTTLMRMIIGEEHADSGEIIIPRNYRIGYLSQNISFTRETVLEQCCEGLSDHRRDDTWLAEKALSGLGFSKQDMGRNPGEFSGGFQVRLNLATVLVSEPDMLLLDEPNNYLDVVSIRWLSRFLNEWNSEVILVTHDRTFMNAVTTHTMGIHRKKIRKIQGDTEKLYEQIIREEEVYEKTRINDEKKRKEIEQFITRFRAKARLAGLVQSRVKLLEKQGGMDRLEQERNLDFSFSFAPFAAKTLLRANDISFSYPGTEPLIRDLGITIGRRDRICVIGKNGKGKTTLLRVLAGELEPGSGRIECHPGIRTGYFTQTNIHTLNPSLTVEEEIMNAGCDRQTARDICGAMMFEEDRALKKTAVLSGGEKSRVLLGKILASEANLLLLDEPTNHLDMESCDTLLAAIDRFPGAVIIVTHNELFLHTLAERLVVFQENRVTTLECDYAGFLEKVGWLEEKQDTPGHGPTSDSSAPGGNRKELRKLRAGILSRRSAELKPLETRISVLESSIESEEKNLEGLNMLIIEASEKGNGEEISRISRDLHSSQARINELYDELDSVTRVHDSRKEEFDLELRELEAGAAEN